MHGVVAPQGMGLGVLAGGADGGYDIGGDAVEILGQALGPAVAEVERGRAICQTLQERRTRVRFEPLPENLLRYYRNNEIVLNESLRGASPSVLAAHPAHEGTHAQWGQCASIDQEYHARGAQAEVWLQLRGD